MRHRFTTAILVAVLFAGSLAAAAPPASGASPSRVVAVGDVHGAIEGLVTILGETGLIDAEQHWIGGDTVLVQTGDLVDRGTGVREVLELIMALQEEAPAQGGQVVVLLGNHEQMSLIREYSDTTPEIFATFADARTEERRDEAYREWAHWLTRLVRSRGGQPPDTGREKRQAWMAEHPPGFFAYVEAFDVESRYGRWLLKRPVAAKIGDTLFVHGGISPGWVGRSLEDIDATYHRELGAFLEERQALAEAGLIVPFATYQDLFGSLNFELQHPPLPDFEEEAQMALARRADERLTGLEIFSPETPLWYRGFAKLSDEELTSLVDRLEAEYGVHHFVVAHTPQATKSIVSRLGGRVFLIDTGMLESFYHGRPSALEIRDGTFTAIYPGERETLLAPEPARNPGPGSEDDVSAPPPGPWLGPDARPLPFRAPEDAEAFLSEARVVSVEDIPTGVTKPRRLLLERDGVQARAVFRDVDRHLRQQRLEGGQFEQWFVDSYKSDLAAYELSKILGIDYIPPAVPRRVQGQEGEVQLWIEGATTYRDWLADGNKGSYALLQQLWDMKVFDLLIRNIDRNEGNILLGSDGRVWWIDHTRSLAQDAKLFHPDELKLCSRHLWKVLKTLDFDTVRRRLDPYLGVYELRALEKRRDALLQLIQEKIDREGEHKALFDRLSAKGESAPAETRANR